MIKFFKTPDSLRRLFPERIWGFSPSNSIYLTFDDGPTELTKWVLEVLNDRDIKATFFCVGENAMKRPEILNSIRAQGHSVGNHTMNHEKGWNIPKSEYLASIDEADEVLKSNLFRPPYGKMPRSLDKELKEKYTIVMWSWLAYDFDKNVGISTILKKATKIEGGDILVLHDNEKSEARLKELLPQLLDYLIGRGFKFKAISV